MIQGEGEGNLGRGRRFFRAGIAFVLPLPEGGGGSVKEAGTHSPPCTQYLPNIKPPAMHQIVKGPPLLPHKTPHSGSHKRHLFRSRSSSESKANSDDASAR